MNLKITKNSVQRILLTVFFLTLSLGQFERIQLTTQVAIYIHELILVGCCLIFLPDLLKEYKNLVRVISKKKSISVLLSFLLLQTVIHQFIQLEVVSALYILRLLLYAQIFLIIRVTLKEKILSRKKLFGLLVLLSTKIAVFGLIQYVIFPDTRELILMGWDDHYYRLISTLFDPGFTGLIMAIGLIIFLHEFYTESKWHNIAIVATLLISILLTYSRASYLALLGGLSYQMYQTRKSLYLFIIFAFLVAIPFLPRPASEGVKLERTASISSRITSNQEALQSLSFSEVIWGKGFYRNIPMEQRNIPNHAIAPDNSFIFILTSIGMVGTVLFIFTLYELRYLFTDKLLTVVTVVLGLHSLFNNSLFYAWSMVIFTTVLATASITAPFRKSEK